MKLAPSILASDLADLAHTIELCEEGEADVVHFDVMDGVFVPNLSFGIPVLKAVRRRTELPIDVHLMVTNPGRLLDAYLDAGADWVSVHWEAATHLDRLLERIRSADAKAGVVLNPTTPVEFLTDALGSLDFVVLMSVNPGFGGQSFLPYTLQKAQRLRKMIDERGEALEMRERQFGPRSGILACAFGGLLQLRHGWRGALTRIRGLHRFRSGHHVIHD